MEEQSPRARELLMRLNAFMAERVYPSEAAYQAHVLGAERWRPVPIVEALKAEARQAGLWNLFRSKATHPEGLSNVEYAPLCEVMGRSPMAPEVFNCNAPDTGNMETLERYGTKKQQERWLKPLLEGTIRSCFSMTEPEVASSDATNISASIRRDGDEYVVNGRKWWSTGAMDARCKLIIFMGKMEPAPSAERYGQHSMLLIPMESPGVKVLRHLTLFGYDDAPHGHAEIDFENVRVPVANILLGEGRGFEVAQGRLGPGRIHHAMRLVGLAERGLEAMCRRVQARRPFGRPLAEQSVTLERIAESRMRIEQARLLTLQAARLMDTVGAREARMEIGMIKVVATNMACQVLDWAIQAHGAAGVSEDFPLAYGYARARALRFADGPDEVHRNQIGRLELAKYPAARGGDGGSTREGG